MPKLGDNEKAQIREWLRDAYQAAMAFDGSERSENALFAPLTFFEDFARAHGQHSATRERRLIQVAFPDHPPDMPVTISGLLGEASGFYDRLRKSATSQDLLSSLEQGGAIVRTSDQVFVKTNDGAFQPGQSLTPDAYEIRTEPRLAALIAHLRNDGVNGQSIYTDDLVITRGTVADGMMRRHPYTIVQIPRLNAEITVCDQIGETTFVKRGTVGPEFWAHMSKDELKARSDIRHVDRHNDGQWWADIASHLSGQQHPKNKVDLHSWANGKPNLDLDLIKKSLLAHRLVTGEWLSAPKRSELRSTYGSYVLEHGPYAGLLKAGMLNAALANGGRGLPGGSSIAALNTEISREHGLDYVNRRAQPDLDLELIKQSLLAHRQATGEWLRSNKRKEPDGTQGSYMLEHGPYAGQITVSALEVSLQKGLRGLPGGSSIAALKAELSLEHGLDYVNLWTQPALDLALVRESLLAHRLTTGEWLTGNKRKEPDGKPGSYMLEHGPYAGQISASTLDTDLLEGLRGLPSGSSIAALNEEISREHGLDYVNRHTQPALNLALVKQSLLAHRQATGEWLISGQRQEPDGKEGSYLLEHGPYAGQVTSGALNMSLMKGLRSLPGGSTIAALNKEISDEHGLDYVNRMKMPPLDLALIKESLLAHRLATGEWLRARMKGADGTPGSYMLEHGPYAGQFTSGALNANLDRGTRGLQGGSSIAKLNHELRNHPALNAASEITTNEPSLDYHS